MLNNIGKILHKESVIMTDDIEDRVLALARRHSGVYLLHNKTTEVTES